MNSAEANAEWNFLEGLELHKAVKNMKLPKIDKINYSLINCLNPVKISSLKKEERNNINIVYKKLLKGEDIVMHVQCGKCVLCLDRWRNDWAKRGVLHSKLYDSKEFTPLFVTLTLDFSVIPESKHSYFRSVQKREHQLFMKRLRDYLRMEKKGRKISYIMSSEYGDPNKTFHPHYHYIIYGLQNNEYDRGLISRAWSFSEKKFRKDNRTVYWTYHSMGFQKIKPASYDQIKYVLKYAMKGVTTSPKELEKRKIWRERGLNDTFYTSSKGFGLKWIDKVKDKFLKKDPKNWQVSYGKFISCLPKSLVKRAYGDDKEGYKKHYQDFFLNKNKEAVKYIKKFNISVGEYLVRQYNKIKQRALTIEKRLC